VCCCGHERAAAEVILMSLVAIRTKAPSPCSEAGRRTPQTPSRAAISRTAEGLSQGLCGQWEEIGRRPIARWNSPLASARPVSPCRMRVRSASVPGLGGTVRAGQ
jgi:hypothetical protein